MSSAPPLCQRGVVVGAGVAGWAAAASLVGICEEVIVVERDRLPLDRRKRPGVPQGDHLHNLLGRAQDALDLLIPGFTSVMRAGTCGDARVADQTMVHELGRRMPERDLGLRLLCAPRSRIEQTLRTEVMALGRIQLMDETRVVGLETDDMGAVRAVLVDGPRGRASLAAGVVVDASGASSRHVDWLEVVGHQAPVVEKISTDRWYVTVELEAPDELADDPTFRLVLAMPPATRSGLISPTGDGRWLVSVCGPTRERPPASYDQVLEFASLLDDPMVVDALRMARPVGRPVRFVRQHVTRRRFDHLTDPVTGLFALGDAVAALDPLLGQGISVAAWQAVELRGLLETSAATGRSLSDVTQTHHSVSGLIADESLFLGRRVDEVLTGGAWAEGRLHDRAIELGRLLDGDRDAHRRYVRVWHLLEPAETIGALLDGEPLELRAPWIEVTAA